jgi:hypothetical protein
MQGSAYEYTTCASYIPFIVGISVGVRTEVLIEVMCVSPFAAAHVLLPIRLTFSFAYVVTNLVF